MEGPLAGVRVLEVANWLAAPAGCALLADFGADVVSLNEGDIGATLGASGPREGGEVRAVYSQLLCSQITERATPPAAGRRLSSLRRFVRDR